MAWRGEARPHVVTPIAYRGCLYVCTDNGILTVYDPADGERLHRLRVGDRGGSFNASPVAADEQTALVHAGIARELGAAAPRPHRSRPPGCGARSSRCG